MPQHARCLDMDSELHWELGVGAGWPRFFDTRWFTIAMENHHFLGVNQLFQWPFTAAGYFGRPFPETSWKKRSPRCQPSPGTRRGEVETREGSNEPGHPGIGTTGSGAVMLCLLLDL